MQRFIPVVLFCLTSVCGMARAAPSAQEANRPAAIPVQSQSEISEAVRAAVFGPTTPQARSGRIARSVEQLSSRATPNEKQLTGATIVFQRGLNPVEVGAFAEHFALEVTRVEIVAPSYDGSGAMPTMSVGSHNLLRLPGSLSERIERSIARYRAQMYISSTRTSGAVSQQLLDTATSQDLFIYKIECIGSAKALSRAAKQVDVSLVLADEDDMALEGYLLTKKQIEAEPNGGKVTIVQRKPDDGPPVGISGISANSPVRDPMNARGVTPPSKLRARAPVQSVGED